MLPVPDLLTVLPSLPRQSLALVGYRAIVFASLIGYPTPHAKVDPLYASGASQGGGRYTPIGGPDAIYLAEDPLTAMCEVGQFSSLIATQHPNQLPIRPPTMVFSVVASLAAVLDVTEPAIHKALGTSLVELTTSWRIQQAMGRVPSQDLGNAAFQTGQFDAIRYPSDKSPGNTCLVVFPKRLQPGNGLEVHDPTGRFYRKVP